jgi:hypothetical protein
LTGLESHITDWDLKQMEASRCPFQRRLADVVKGTRVVEANGAGWPPFNRKYVVYARFKKDWWTYLKTYHMHVQNDLLFLSHIEGEVSSPRRKICGRRPRGSGQSETRWTHALTHLLLRLWSQ